jgi:hypothetical protein
MNKLIDNQQAGQDSSDDEGSDLDQDLEVDGSESEPAFKDGHQFDVDSEQTDLSDIGLCSINNHERLFNILLCYLQLGDKRNAVKILKKLDKGCPHKYQE